MKRKSVMHVNMFLSPENQVLQVLKQKYPENWQKTGITKAYYCDLIERLVVNAVPWVDPQGAVIDPVIGKEWGQTTSRFASSGATALYFGRCSEHQETVFRAMDYACRELTSEKIKERSPDFWMRELAVAWKLLENIAPAERHESWRRALAKVEPQKHYSQVAESVEGRKKLRNWNVFGSAGESLRESFGIGGPADALWGNAFFDTYMEHQIQWFNEYGMYRDPNDPFTYDITTRLQIATALHFGYRGKLAAELDELNRKGNLTLLLILSPSGEVPFGGRSSQFHFQEAIVAALCELEVCRYKKENPRLAAAFKRQAHISALAVRDSILREDGKVFHIKNRFAPETRHGCDCYGHYSVYSLLAGSLFGLAALFADDAIPEAPSPAELGGFCFAIKGSFEKAFANKNGNYLEFDLLANIHEDATGLGRVFLKGLSRAILPAVPFAPVPNFLLAPSLPVEQVAAAIAPEWTDHTGKIQRLAEKNTQDNSPAGSCRAIDVEKGLFEACFHHENVKITYLADINTPGELRLTVQLAGACSNPCLILPLLEFDGEKQIDPLKVLHLSQIPQKGNNVANRNGMYRLYRFPMQDNSISLTIRLGQTHCPIN